MQYKAAKIEVKKVLQKKKNWLHEQYRIWEDDEQNKDERERAKGLEWYKKDGRSNWKKTGWRKMGRLKQVSMMETEKMRQG